MSEQHAAFIVIHNHCPLCGKCVQTRVPAKGYDYWHRLGVPIQIALKDVSETKRESLMTGFCSSCQDDIFNDPDEEVTLNAQESSGDKLR